MSRQCKQTDMREHDDRWVRNFHLSGMVRGTSWVDRDTTKTNCTGPSAKYFQYWYYDLIMLVKPVERIWEHHNGNCLPLWTLSNSKHFTIFALAQYGRLQCNSIFMIFTCDLLINVSASTSCTYVYLYHRKGLNYISLLLYRAKDCNTKVGFKLIDSVHLFYFFFIDA